MRRQTIAVWVIFVGVMGVSLGRSAPACVDAPLSQYLAMGPAGCTLAAPPDGVFLIPVTVTDFRFTAAGAASSADDIRVLPFNYPPVPGIILTGMSSDPATLDDFVTFAIHAPVNQTNLFNQLLTGQAHANVCAGAAFAPDGSCDSPGAQYRFDGPGGGASFASVTVLGIRDEIVLNGESWPRIDNLIQTPGGYGTCDCAIPGGLPLTSTPEPLSFWLATPFAAALLMVHKNRRGHRSV